MSSAQRASAGPALRNFRAETFAERSARILCGVNPRPRKIADRVHELMDLALPEARSGPEKATSETGGVIITLVTPDADKSDSH